MLFSEKAYYFVASGHGLKTLCTTQKAPFPLKTEAEEGLKTIFVQSCAGL